MGRYTGPMTRLSRRDGVALTDKCAMVMKRRPNPPGVHGPKAEMSRGRQSTFGLQLREKQKAKHYYGIRERQFSNYFKKAKATKGDTGLELIRLLEMRLDSVIYRMGFASTRRQARQMVVHGFFAVNGISVNIPSYTVKIGDVIVIKDTKKKKTLTQSVTDRLGKGVLPSWLAIEAGILTGRVLSSPSGSDIQPIFDPKLIIEFYSR